MKRYIEKLAPNIGSGFIIRDPLELFKEDYQDTNPQETFSLTTSRGQCEVISYYGNEIGFFWKLKAYSKGQLLIITQSDMTWIEDLLQEQFLAW